MCEIEDFFRATGILFLTNKCNNHCIICQDSKMVEEKKLMRGLEELKKDIDFFVSKGKKSIEIYGGEPFLNRNMPAVLDYLSQFDLKCNFNSNGRVFADKSIVKKLLKLKNPRVQTSFFSYRENIHDYITNTPGSWRQEKIQEFKPLFSVTGKISTIT